MFEFLANLFSDDSTGLLDCLKCGKAVGSGNFVRMSVGEKINYYVECKCGSIGMFSDSKEGAASRWNEMVQKDDGEYRRAKATMDEFRKALGRSTDKP